MKIELIVILITIFFIVNTYYDNKYLKQLVKFKRGKSDCVNFVIGAIKTITNKRVIIITKIV